MAYDECNTYTLGYQGVQANAPGASGIYTIYSARQWLYVGESENIQQSLFSHLNAPEACMDRFGPLSFSFEIMPTAERGPRQRALVTELQPTCQTK